jgi:hypothetical protein
MDKISGHLPQRGIGDWSAAAEDIAGTSPGAFKIEDGPTSRRSAAIHPTSQLPQLYRLSDPAPESARAMQLMGEAKDHSLAGLVPEGQPATPEKLLLLSHPKQRHDDSCDESAIGNHPYLLRQRLTHRAAPSTAENHLQSVLFYSPFEKR